MARVTFYNSDQTAVAKLNKMEHEDTEILYSHLSGMYLIQINVLIAYSFGLYC